MYVLSAGLVNLLKIQGVVLSKNIPIFNDNFKKGTAFNKLANNILVNK